MKVMIASDIHGSAFFCRRMLDRYDEEKAEYTHIPACVDQGAFIYMNPGSVSIPKNGNPHSYMVLKEKEFLWKELDTGNVFMNYIWKA